MSNKIGPWYHEKRDVRHFVLSEDSGLFVAEITNANTPEGDAHAALIAVAPEMLEALEASLKRLDWFVRSTVWHGIEEYNKINRERIALVAAIAKARGEK